MYSIVPLENLFRLASVWFLAVHLQDLKATGKVWVLMNSDSQEDIVYPNDPKIVIKVL